MKRAKETNGEPARLNKEEINVKALQQAVKMKSLTK